jgi:hypothetical protein
MAQLQQQQLPEQQQTATAASKKTAQQLHQQLQYLMQQLQPYNSNSNSYASTSSPKSDRSSNNSSCSSATDARCNQKGSSWSSGGGIGTVTSPSHRPRPPGACNRVSQLKTRQIACTHHPSARMRHFLCRLGRCNTAVHPAATTIAASDHADTNYTTTDHLILPFEKKFLLHL